MQQIESFLFNVIQANYKMPKQFLRWWLLVVLTIIGAVVANYFKATEFLYNHDSTMLSFVIIGIFFLCSSVIGYKLFMTEKGHSSFQNYESEWFISELCLSLGLTGTVLGFVMVLLGTFENLNLDDVVSVQNAISSMASGMGVALLTTLSGIICSMLLKSQLIIAESDS